MSQTGYPTTQKQAIRKARGVYVVFRGASWVHHARINKRTAMRLLNSAAEGEFWVLYDVNERIANMRAPDDLEGTLLTLIGENGVIQEFHYKGATP